MNADLPSTVGAPVRVDGKGEPIAFVDSVSEDGRITLRPAPGHTADEIAALIRAMTGPVPLGFSIRSGRANEL